MNLVKKTLVQLPWPVLKTYLRQEEEQWQLPVLGIPLEKWIIMLV